MKNIKIRAVANYHPENVVGNDFYIEHFKEQGRDITDFLEFMGRKERFIIDNERENTITMGIEASKRALEKSGLEGKDIDLVVFSTQVPEYTFPTNAMFLHQAIQAKRTAVALDSNANCAGMLVAVEQATRYMMSNPHVNRALVVGSDYNSLVANKEEEITYANYGDASSAVILEKTEEDTGFVDSIYDLDSAHTANIMYPAKGFSKTIKEESTPDGIRWLPFSGDLTLNDTYRIVEELLSRNGLTHEDINSYCLSQFSLSNILKFQENFKVPDEKIVYVGDKFGYTGTSSPFIAFNEGVESGQIKRGDTVLFWTVGAGNILIAMLFKY